MLSNNKKLYFSFSLFVAIAIACLGYINGSKLDEIYKAVAMPEISSSPILKPELGAQYLTTINRGSWHAMLAHDTPSVWIKYDYHQPVLARKITLQRQQQGDDRAPKDFSLLGSEDDISYSPIANFKGISFAEDGMWGSPISAEKSYRFFKLGITGNNGNPELVTLRYFWLDVTTSNEIKLPQFTQALQNPALFLLAGMAYLVVLSMFFKSARDKLVQLFSFHATSSKLASLDMWRGMAALSVAAMHITVWGSPLFDKGLPEIFLANAALAVSFFVVLSGYLITMILHRVETVTQIQSYFVRRILRLYPLYIFVLICMIVVTWPNSFGSHDRRPLAFFVGNLMMFPALGLQLDRFIIPHAWSLFVEVLFYLVMPVIVFAGKPRLLLVSIVLFVAFSLSEANIINPTLNREFSIWKFFFVGAIIFQVSARWGDLIKEWMANVLVLIGLLFLFFHASRDIGSDLYHSLNLPPYVEIQDNLLLYSHYDQFVAISTLFLILGSIHSSTLSRFANTAPFKILGAISYSVFLIHPFFFKLFVSSVSTTAVDMSAVHIPQSVLFAVLLPALLSLFAYVSFRGTPILDFKTKINRGQY